ncbi:protein kinase domain-containing protein [Pectobacterium brasiliense]|uniref:protein kinase domain-containing protein n=1 Tax=Pectobacterium brasiliense TaxID=180957 RepID=UPI00057E8942|nr:protein kinase [Pectobacterium brasiliense]APS28628.1 hypothetical protein NC16_02325 [Pectobacterium brasiliense]KHS99330.1 hypothetical protein RC91_17935 [Pectobacterium brasiliense]MBN3104104.1 protein kinase [Pectobacterium brasiliense]MBN3183376.1 protein kinase [Pectobacterium brasiliense]PPE57744.1 protein kinase [Pectobacterium brasiliense]
MANNKRKIRPQDLNGWLLGNSLGKGGNGQVWEVEKNGQKGALKHLLHDSKLPRVARFQDEVKAMRKCSDIPGVLPVYDEHLGSPPRWFVMAHATPIRDSLSDSAGLHDIVSAIHGIAKVLAAMHARGVTHRDIKPENLFIHNGIWSVGDFGLATFEGKESKTLSGEKIGPIHYIAPEMLNDAAKSKGEPSDVFSLAKTLWVLATGQNFALPGSYYSKYDVFRIGQYVDAERTSQLDKLIEASTAISPESRPNMKNFEDELAAWLAPVRMQVQTTVKIDIGSYAAKMDNAQTELEAKRDREREEYFNHMEVTKRLKDSFQPFLIELKTALKELNFRDVKYQNEHGTSVTAYIASTDQTSPRFTVSLGTEIKNSTIKITASVIFERGPSIFSRLLIWSKEIEFIEGSSRESSQIAALLDSIKKQMSMCVNMALAIAFGPNLELTNSSLLMSNKIEVVDEEGNPIQNSTIAIIRKDGLHKLGVTGKEGIAFLSDGPKDPFLVFVAHENFKGKASPITERSIKVTLEKENNVGSLFANTGWLSIPNIGHGIDFIIDSNERMYIYSSKDISINNGSAQPFNIEIGKSVHLKNDKDQVAEIRLSAATGTCILLDVKT